VDIQFGGTLGLGDFRRAQSLDGRTRVYSLIALAFVGIAIAIQVWSFLTTPFSISSLILLMPLVIGALVFWLALRFIVQRSWKQSQTTFAAISGTISDDAVAYNTAQSQSRSAWDLFQRYKIAPDMVLLYQTTNAFNVFPRHFFSTEADWAAFVQLVQQKIAKR
jgi:hypothetical protein